MTGFTVDPRIFHELGALLVKRDSIALTELIKNAYDADAQRVVVLGERLSAEDGRIVVVDDGVGMAEPQFRNGFLRIASRSKETETRRSDVRGRRFTGEKGVGRLSAHKLGAVLEVDTVALADQPRWTGTHRVFARVDWDAVEREAVLEDLPPAALDVETSTIDPRSAGTRIEISRLRGEWSQRELQDFVVEADLFEPPQVLLDPLSRIVGGPLLFNRLLLRDTHAKDDRFSVQLAGDFQVGEQLWQQVPDAAWWVVEIDSTPERVIYQFEPTHLARAERPHLVGDRVVYDAVDAHRPRFQARIFAREGQRSPRDRAFASRVSGVRVYMEGFRISPYGERGDDWLSLDRDYARRTDRLGLALPELGTASGTDREGLRTLPNNAYVGAVLLTHAGAPALEAPVDREGFLESRQLDSLRRSIRIGLDLLTRHRARLGVAIDVAGGDDDGSPVLLADEIRVRDGLSEAVQQARTLQRKVASGAAPTEEVEEVTEKLTELSRLADRAVSDRVILRILAAAGTQMAVFIHEIENIVSSVGSIRRQLQKLSKESPGFADRFEELERHLVRVQERVAAQAEFLSDIASAGARQRRRRIRLSEAIPRAWQLLEPAAKRLNVTLDSTLDPKARSSVMFPAELSAVLSNLFTNALKAAGAGGAVRVAATGGTGESRLTIQNTGAKVSLEEAERWFLPFESTSSERVDPLLGQGMGLGLPIVRSTLSDYGATIQFVQPDPDMSTSVEIRFS